MNFYGTHEISLILLLLTFGTGEAQWVQQASGTQSTLWSVSMIDRRVGMSVFNDTVLKTTNGGSTWLPSAAGLPVILTSIFFADDSLGWSAGSRIIRSVNGGRTWQDVTPSNSGFINGIFFVNSRIGWTFGQVGFYEGKILKTTNGGVSWIEQRIVSHWYLLSGHFLDSLNGWTVGLNSLFKTSNGGETWEEQDTLFTHTVGVPLSSIWFVDREHGWYVGGISEVTVIAKTTNGGKHWTHQIFDPAPPSFPVSRLNSVQFVNLRKGWAVGRGYASPQAFIAATTDGGETWHKQDAGSSPTIQQLESVSFVDSLHGWAVGQNGTILATTNGGTTFVSPTDRVPEVFSLHQNFPNPFNPSTRIRFVLPSTCKVNLEVFDILARKVATLVAGELHAGEHEAEFTAENLSSGAYYYRMRAEPVGTPSEQPLSATKVMIVLK